METLESRQLLSIAPFHAAVDFGTHDGVHRPAIDIPFNASAEARSARGEVETYRTPGGYGGLADDSGTRDAFRDPWSHDSPDPAHDWNGSAPTHDQSNLESSGGHDWHNAEDWPVQDGSHRGLVDVNDSLGDRGSFHYAPIPIGGGQGLLVQSSGPVKVLVAASASGQSTLVLFTSDRDSFPTAAPASGVRLPEYVPTGHAQYGEGETIPGRSQPAAQRAPAHEEYERAEVQQNRPAGGREARGIVSRAPAASTANAYVNAAGPATAGEPAPVRAGPAPAEAPKSGGIAAAVAAAAGHVVDVAPAARAAGAVVAAVAPGAGTTSVTVDYAAAAAWRGMIGRVEAALADLDNLIESVTSVGDAVDAVAVAADVADVGSGLLHLPTGPVMFLGLAPTGIASPRSSWWPSQQAWRVTEAVSFVVAVAGYGYCRADAERRRVRSIPFRSAVTSARRPGDGL
jgi:hypothetical protein